MQQLTGDDRRVAVAAIALALGALASLIVEAVVAAAWTHSGYSYAYGYISGSFPG